MGTGVVKSQQGAHRGGVDLKEVHYDFWSAVCHDDAGKMMAIHGDVCEPLVTGWRPRRGIYGPLKEHGVELLKHDPEFGIDRIGIITPEGEGYIKGVIALEGSRPRKTSPDGGMTLGRQAGCRHHHRRVARRWSRNSRWRHRSPGLPSIRLCQAEDDRLVSKIILENGELTVNGKPQEFRGLAGRRPKPMRMGPAEGRAAPGVESAPS